MVLLPFYRWTYQAITLKNPTNEILELTPVITNTNNYTLEREVDKPIILKAKGKTEVTLRFMPTSLGDSEHIGRIIFRSDRVSCNIENIAFFSCVHLFLYKKKDLKKDTKIKKNKCFVSN